VSSISKAFILGAGLGTRLRPLTHTLPKPLVPIGNKPLVHYTLDACILAGIESFAINTHHLPEEWEAAFPQQHYQGKPIEFFHETTLLETGGGLKNISSFFQNEPILVINGDILSSINLKSLIEQHTNSPAIATLALIENGPNRNIAVDKGLVTDLRHARGIHSGTHQFTGMYCTDPAILNLIPAEEKVSVIPAFLKLAEQEKLAAFHTKNSSWNDLGTREVYLEVNQRLAENGSGIHPDAKIHPLAEIDQSSVIGPLAVIPEGCKIQKSVIWSKAVLSKNTKLDQCVVRHRACGEHTCVDL